VEGDSTANIVWRFDKGLPNIPSPILYRGVLYLLREGGILTAFDPATGQIWKQGRVEGALGSYFASPVASDDKLYLLSQEGNLAAVRAGKDWAVLKVSALGEECWSTPAIGGGAIYVRTQQALYCFRGASGRS
jgi:outer membrane protein assembly factor BamB